MLPSDREASGSALEDDSGNTALWIGLGLGAAALIGGAVAVVAVRSRRRSAAATVPAQPFQPPYAYQQHPRPPYDSYNSPPAPPGSDSPYGAPQGRGPAT